MLYTYMHIYMYISLFSLLLKWLALALIFAVIPTSMIINVHKNE